MRIVPHLAPICVFQPWMCVIFPPVLMVLNTERLDIQGKRLEVYKQASLENLLYFTEGCPNKPSVFLPPLVGIPPNKLLFFLSLKRLKSVSGDSGKALQIILCAYMARTFVWTEFREMTTPAEWGSHAAGGVFLEGGSFKLSSWSSNEHRFSAEVTPRVDILKTETSVLSSETDNLGILDFYRILISHRPDNILAPLLQFSHDVCSTWSKQVCSFSPRVNWGTCSHQVPGPENFKEKFKEKSSGSSCMQ